MSNHPALLCFAATASLALLYTAAGSQIRTEQRNNAEFTEAQHADLTVGVNTLSHEYPYYHTSAEIKDELQRMAEPKGCRGASFTVTSHTDSGITIDMVNIRSKTARPSHRVFLVANEHARELITAESALYFVRALCGDGEAAFGSTSTATSLLQLEQSDLERARATVLEDVEFAVVLNANPKSRQKVEDEGDYCLRANPNNVDLNRNWDEHWQTIEGSSSTAGPSAFSEPESRIVRDLVTKFKPTAFLSIHSGTLGMYMPWAYSSDFLATSNQAQMMDVLRSLDKDHCECPYGAAGKEVGYPCSGTSVDYAYDKLKSPYSFAFEIWGGDAQLLKERWGTKLMERGTLLLQADSPIPPNLADPFFKEVFAAHPSDFVGLQLSANVDAETKTRFECMGTFNPTNQEAYDKAVKNWATAYADMAVRIAEQQATAKTESRHSNRMLSSLASWWRGNTSRPTP